MALTPETGTGISNADSFAANVAEVTAYHTAFGNLGAGDGQWDDTADDSVLEPLIRRGWQAFNTLYRMRLQGVKSVVTQNSVVPRAGMADEDGIGILSTVILDDWKNASFELARIVPSDQATDESLWIRRVEAGEVSVLFQSPMHSRTVLDHVEAMMAPYLSNQSGRG